MHALIDVQETSFSIALLAPAIAGVDWIDHAVPFHRSASVACAPELPTYSPTAVQALLGARHALQGTAPDQAGSLLDCPGAAIQNLGERLLRT